MAGRAQEHRRRGSAVPGRAQRRVPRWVLGWAALVGAFLLGLAAVGGPGRAAPPAAPTSALAALQATLAAAPVRDVPAPTPVGFRSNSHLPLGATITIPAGPPTAAVVTPPHTGTGGEPAGGYPLNDVAPLTGTPAPLRATAAVADPTPPASGTITIQAALRRGEAGVPGARMRSVWHFRSGPAACDGAITDAAGEATCALDVANATVGYPVTVEVSFDYAGQTYTARTVFVPRP